MKETQFNKLANKLIKSDKQREAVRLHVMGGLSAYEAEKQVHGKITTTVSRDAKRINELYEFAKDVMQAV